MDILEISEERKMSREDAAKLLRELADSLARHNSVEIMRNGIKINVNVPDEVTREFEVEIEDEEASIEVEISW